MLHLRGSYISSVGTIEFRKVDAFVKGWIHYKFTSVCLSSVVARLCWFVIKLVKC
jgi:hypothetical protein